MNEIVFMYKEKEVPIQYSDGEKMKNIIERFFVKINESKSFIFMLNDGKIIDKEFTEDQIFINEDNKKIILVKENDYTSNINKEIQISKEVICPICKEICLIEIKDYKVLLYNCKKGHNSNILINQFKETQLINKSDITCNICKEKNKKNLKNKFYNCINCEINICSFCKSKHNNEHNIINCDKINYICNEHFEQFFGYCLNCKKNLCNSCEFEHDGHEIISYGKILKNKKEIIENNAILRKNIDKLKIIIQKIINKLNNVMDVIEQYYEINKNIIKNINNKNRNYETLFNINSMNHNHIFDDINNIINEKDINIQFKNLIKIYKSMN